MSLKTFQLILEIMLHGIFPITRYVSGIYPDAWHIENNGLYCGLFYCCSMQEAKRESCSITQPVFTRGSCSIFSWMISKEHLSVVLVQ